MKKLLYSLYTACLFLLFLSSCNENKDCDRVLYLGLSAALKGDRLVILIDDSLKYNKTISDDYLWSDNDMRKLINESCVKDSIVNITLKLLNTGQDTVFNINTNLMRGLYFSTPTATSGEKYIFFYDYYNGGLKDVIWTDRMHPR